MIRWLRVFAALAFALAMQAAHAQYPSRPIRWVVPFPAGGATDIAARSIAHAMSQSLGQPFLIDNRPGGDGLIAGEYVARSLADGYTLLFATATGMSFSPVTRKTMPYDVVNDFTPIGRIGNYGFFLYVNSGVPVKSLPELISYGRSNPGKLNYGTSGAISLLAARDFGQAVNVDMTHVPYRGDAPLFADLVSGRIELSFAAGVGLPHVASGKLRVLATTLPRRVPTLPEVPALVEAGIRGMSFAPWTGMFGPAHMPREVVDRLAGELARALAQDEVREQLRKMVFEPVSSTPEELGALVREQLVAWRRATLAAGIQPE